MRRTSSDPPADEGPIDSSWYDVIEEFPDAAVVRDRTQRVALLRTRLPWRVVHRASKIEMLLVAPGTFRMGRPVLVLGPEGGLKSDCPAHDVMLTRPYYLSRTEVSEDSWSRIMSGGADAGDRASFPVSRVSFRDVAGDETSFCGRTGLRLPTEAEWEYACRAGTATTFHTGDDIHSRICNYDVTFDSDEPDAVERRFHTRVGSFPPNQWGFHDMHGNVAEWCNDWWQERYYSSVAGSVAVDPPGPDHGPFRVTRGGSCCDPKGVCAAFARAPFSEDVQYDFIGFRVARDAR